MDRKPNGYWTCEKCKKEALKYDNRSSFKKNPAWRHASKGGWLNDICSHMKTIVNPTGYWDYNRCKDISSKYKNRTELRINEPGAYGAIKRNKWYDLFSHMEFLKMPCNFWTKDKCHDEASKCDTISDFQKNNRSAYIISSRNGWIDEICGHMIKIGNKMKRCIYSCEFPDNSVYVGLTYNFNNRIKSHLNRRSSIFNYINMTGLEPNFIQLTEYIDVEESIKMEKYYLTKYKMSGWKTLNVVKTGGIGGNTLTWNFENCQKESLKYFTRQDFCKNSCGAYTSALKNGWLNDICKHMNFTAHPKNYWTYDRCKNELLKFGDKSFIKSKAYYAACQNGWIKDIKNEIKN